MRPSVARIRLAMAVLLPATCGFSPPPPLIHRKSFSSSPSLPADPSAPFSRWSAPPASGCSLLLRGVSGGRKGVLEGIGLSLRAHRGSNGTDDGELGAALEERLEGIDRTLATNDCSVLALYSFSQAIINQIVSGPKSVPGYTFEDAIFLTRTFSDAAILSVSWLAAALVTGVLKREDVSEGGVGLAYLGGVVGTWCLAGPMAQALKLVAGHPSPTGEVVRDLVWCLALMLLWRYFDSQQPSL